MTQELIERLHKLADRQRRERGDAMYLGEHDPEISEAADALQSQSARIAELEGLLWRAMDDASIEPGDWYAEARNSLNKDSTSG